MVEDLNIKKGRFIKWYRLRCPFCGHEMYKPYLYLVIKHIIRKRNYYACSNCHRTTCYVSYFNTTSDHNDEKERILNKKIWDSRYCR